MVFIVTNLYKKESQKLFQAGLLKEQGIVYTSLSILADKAEYAVMSNLPNFSLEKVLLLDNS